MTFLVMIALISFTPSILGGKDPCSSYIELSDTDRELRFTKETGKSDRDDLEAGVWYRITGKAGYKMANRLKRKEKECPTGIHCGTSVPGFMIGRHPQIKGNVRTRKVCFSKGGNCCAYKVTIKVKRCPNRVLVYQLPKAPIGNARYCSFARKQKPNKPPSTTTLPTTTKPPVRTGEDKNHPGKSCKVIKQENPQGGSGLYWINPDGGYAFQAYCDQETDGGGWTLVYSYRFTNYQKFLSGSNAVTPRPSWPANGDIPESRTTPLSETIWGAMDFSLWQQIGHEFMAKSNINHWIVCAEGCGSLVEYRAGTLSCRVVKNIASACHNTAPDEIRVLTKESAQNFGPHLYNSKSPTWLKTYYYWESSTQSPNWPTHDPCGRNGLSHVKNVANPHGNIFIR